MLACCGGGFVAVDLFLLLRATVDRGLDAVPATVAAGAVGPAAAAVAAVSCAEVSAAGSALCLPKNAAAAPLRFSWPCLCASSTISDCTALAAAAAAVQHQEHNMLQYALPPTVKGMSNAWIKHNDRT